ncbi:lecithin retinol acyltransferase family protein [Azonexus sp.]|uniref:lecithin retinol acyltransferase family protein n=1 Tax=Azonexus sp. TaxID=1872668 RepID=UPI0027B9B889|nr:lecithin retinol acyltransferase family protein [Azonexus sp.]
MSVVDDLNTLFRDLGNELSSLGQALHVITEETLAEIRNDLVSDIRDSTSELAGMGICHPLLGKRQDSVKPSRRSGSPVIPIEGSILYTDLVGEYAQHSGVYIGHGRIVDLNRHGEIQIVSPREFMSGGTGTEIHVSCIGSRAIGSREVAERAYRKVGQRMDYHMLLNNCHQFASGCLSGNYENGDNFLWMLKASTVKHLGADNWHICRID